MNNAELYNKFNQAQIRDAEEIINKFNEVFDCNSSLESYDLIDIGTGCGEVLSSVIFEKLKISLGAVIGTDISPEMIEFAKRNYENEFLKFYCVDVLGNVSATETIIGKQLESFDVVTSFYCLQWIHDLRNAMLSVRNLLKPSGHFLFSLLKTHTVFDAYLNVSKNDKFSSYMHDLHKYFPTIYNVTDPVENITKLASDLGFEIKLLEHKKKVFDFETKANFKNSMEAVSPFTPRMPKSVQVDFMNEIADFTEASINSNEKENVFEVPYEISYVILKKPAQE